MRDRLSTFAAAGLVASSPLDNSGHDNSSPLVLIPSNQMTSYNVKQPNGLPEAMIAADPPVGLHITVPDSRWVHALKDLLCDGGINAEVAALFVPNRGSMVIPFLKDVGTILSYRQERGLLCMNGTAASSAIDAR